jgi:hypothetical protein
MGALLLRRLSDTVSNHPLLTQIFEPFFLSNLITWGTEGEHLYNDHTLGATCNFLIGGSGNIG